MTVTTRKLFLSFEKIAFRKENSSHTIGTGTDVEKCNRLGNKCDPTWNGILLLSVYGVRSTPLFSPSPPEAHILKNLVWWNWKCYCRPKMLKVAEKMSADLERSAHAALTGYGFNILPQFETFHSVKTCSNATEKASTIRNLLCRKTRNFRPGAECSYSQLPAITRILHLSYAKLTFR